MGIIPDYTFQVTDLSRHHRDVMDAARHPAGALIRDKDGESFLLRSAGAAVADTYVLEGMRVALQVINLLTTAPGAADPLFYGQLAWVSVLPEEAQQQFIWEYVRALQAVSGTGIEPVEDLLYAWQQTARAWADEELRGELSADLANPLATVEL